MLSSVNALVIQYLCGYGEVDIPLLLNIVDKTVAIAGETRGERSENVFPLMVFALRKG